MWLICDYEFGRSNIYTNTHIYIYILYLLFLWRCYVRMYSSVSSSLGLSTHPESSWGCQVCHRPQKVFRYCLRTLHVQSMIVNKIMLFPFFVPAKILLNIMHYLWVFTPSLDVFLFKSGTFLVWCRWTSWYWYSFAFLLHVKIREYIRT